MEDWLKEMVKETSPIPGLDELRTIILAYYTNEEG